MVFRPDVGFHSRSAERTFILGSDQQRPAATGISGLDDVLRGGFPRNRMYLLQGEPGSGKTTLALQFLLEGVRLGEPVLYVTLSETEEELRAVAVSHGWSLEGISIHDLATSQATLEGLAENTLFHPSEVELQETTRTLLVEVERVKPRRVVFDSLSELRLLAQNALRYRRQILALKQHFAGSDSTVMLLDDRTSEAGDLQLESLAHGVVTLEQVPQAYGPERRRLRVAKLRGWSFRGGFHDYKIETGGIAVYPRLVAAEHRRNGEVATLSSGNAGLDALLGGGLHRGTATLLLGPAGTGKSALGVQFAVAAARRGERAAIFVFEEGLNTLLARSEALGTDLRPHVDAGTILLQQVDPAELSPGEFAHLVRKAVEEQKVRVLVIDSVTGYLNAMPEERFLTLHMRELLSFLNQSDVVTLMVLSQHGMLGASMKSPVDVSYLADTVLLLRYFEADGAVRKAIAAVKKRSGAHETTIREFDLGSGGLRVGRPLHGFHGVLSGVPTYRGTADALLKGTSSERAD